jgi:hypothetical protein
MNIRVWRGGKEMTNKEIHNVRGNTGKNSYPASIKYDATNRQA